MDLQLYKTALSSAPTSVVIVTTLDGQGRPRGFTAGSFASLSLSPPLVMVSLHRNAECHAAFETAERFAISVLGPKHEDLARLLATRGADKFGGGHFHRGPHGLLFAAQAVAMFVCRSENRYPGGDHTILVGAVEDVGIGETEKAMVHFRRGFYAVGQETGAEKY
jgi:flavin reductase ActVB